ncbi:hypothetical protein H6F46_06570 [Limnothrix sp. FACHB-1083]|nr:MULTISPECIES: hypothetical protein [unclassified Limnothrix]MBD2160356.1 hypothetical protein [Limnothrix sp. FACHB-1083]MBD2191057.1 hypothetical protein [Limnothrix sp. FACHB-1088]
MGDRFAIAPLTFGGLGREWAGCAAPATVQFGAALRSGAVLLALDRW